MLKIAHRGNVIEKYPDQENTLLYLLRAVSMGYGVETDLRRAPCGRLIISHDPAKWNALNDAALILNNLRMNNAYIALNIKESGLLEDLMKITGWNIKNPMNGFVFDFELCHNVFWPHGEMKQYQANGFKVAERLSDRGEKPTLMFDYIWFDEMDKTNSINLDQIKFLKELNFGIDKMIYVSPELHGRNFDDRRKDEFFAICTDYCLLT